MDLHWELSLASPLPAVCIVRLQFDLLQHHVLFLHGDMPEDLMGRSPWFLRKVWREFRDSPGQQEL